MNEGARTALLRGEMLARMNQGWDVVEQSAFEMTMTHSATPPAWRMLVELVNPIYWLSGAPTYPILTRTLRISVDEHGAVHRRTAGELPSHWPRADWEVDDDPARPE
ncbi:hypothetical protein MUN74_07775 [Agromyces endophyticus]|uniref:hypothetical protein n=1 Tax=Agromyces sp. H17E-10 TaxID=2932244 RepID=UPI001FD19B24|nr:hypothetical protein [Agromyces sp. H17E-10]UOQ90789.1 hypothetical protein MUN74_07775 [Agromyces sp. H17E-10]